MHSNSLNHASLLELGFVLLAGSLLAGLGVLIGGRLAADAQHRQRHAESAPLPGTIGSERHQQLSTSPR